MGYDDDKTKTKATGAGTVGGAAVGGVAGGAAAGAAAGGMTGPVGAAVGAAVGAGVGALSGRAAADDGTSTGSTGAMGSGGTTGTTGSYGSHMTVIGAFDSDAQAQRAKDQLVAEGFDRSDVHVERDDGQQSPTTTQETHKSGGFFSWLFGDDDHYQQPRNTYSEAVRRGSSVVVVDVSNEQEAERAVSCLHSLGAVDVDERAQQWRSEGWTDRQPATGSANLGSGTTTNVGKEGVLDVVEEKLQVGKRQLEKGGVRVIQRVTQKPVREVVRLREERAVVDRRAVDRPANAADFNAARDSTLEIRETAEEAVVGKTARVVEEVRVGKEVREREETIEDTVRRKDVDVQRMEGSREVDRERERAVAADDQRDDVRLNRDPDAGGNEREIGMNRDSTGKPRKNL